MGGRGSSANRNSVQAAIDAYVSKDNRYISDSEAKILSNAIKQEGSNFDTVYRTVSPQEFGFNKVSQLRDNIDSIVGKAFGPEGFISTAKTREGTAGFLGVTLEISPNGIKGLDISERSKRKNEQEVLYDRGVAYQITSAKVLRDKEGDYMGLEIKAKLVKRRN